MNEHCWETKPNMSCLSRSPRFISFTNTPVRSSPASNITHRRYLEYVSGRVIFVYSSEQGLRCCRVRYRPRSLRFPQVLRTCCYRPGIPCTVRHGIKPLAASFMYIFWLAAVHFCLLDDLLGLLIFYGKIPLPNRHQTSNALGGR